MKAEARAVILSSSLIEAITSDMVAATKVETCGLLLATGNSVTIDDFVAYDGPLFARSFRLSEPWLLGAFLRQRELRNSVVGYYHTHPPGSLLSPSKSDLDGHPPGSLVLLLGYDSHQRTHWQFWRSSVEDRGWRSVEAVLLQI